MKYIFPVLLLSLLCSCASNEESIPVDTILPKAERLDNLSDLKEKLHLSNYLFSKAQQEELNQIGKFWDKKLGLQQDCKEDREVISMRFMLLKPIDLPGG